MTGLGDDYDEFDEEDREADCGRWDNGALTRHCRLAGSEWCDWECPLNRAVTFRDYERLAYYANVAYVVFISNGARK